MKKYIIFFICVFTIFGCSSPDIDSSSDTQKSSAETKDENSDPATQPTTSPDTPASTPPTSPTTPATPPATIPPLEMIPDQTTGSLDLLKVAVSPAHGIQKNTKDLYDFQRSVINNLRSDVYTQDFCLKYLYPSLERCGASVIAMRDRDRTRIGISGHEAWMESALLYLTYIKAAAASITSINDITIRPWHAINMGADCFMHISLNNNGLPTNTSVRGTQLYVWTSLSDQSKVTDFSHLPSKSAEYANSINENLFKVAALVDPDWKYRSILSLNTGLLRVLKEQHDAGSAHIPGVVIELGYSDHVLEAEQLKKTVMMATMARALTVSVIDSMTSHIGLYPPMRPTDVVAASKSGYIEVTWAGGDDPFDAASSEPEAYVVKVFSESGSYLGSRQVSSSNLSAQFPTTGTGTVHVTVSAKNAYGESINSDEVVIAY